MRALFSERRQCEQCGKDFIIFPTTETRNLQPRLP